MDKSIHGAEPTPELALADAWASMDGKLAEFRDGFDKPIDDQPGGYFTGYMCEAESMIERLERRGFKIVKIEGN